MTSDEHTDYILRVLRKMVNAVKIGADCAGENKLEERRLDDVRGERIAGRCEQVEIGRCENGAIDAMAVIFANFEQIVDEVCGQSGGRTRRTEEVVKRRRLVGGEHAQNVAIAVGFDRRRAPASSRNLLF